MKHPRLIISGLVLLILTFGTFAAYRLTQTNQDLRQQAGFNPPDYNQFFFITPVSHRIGWPEFDYPNMKARLGGDQPYIKIGMMAGPNEFEQTTGDIDGDGVLDDNGDATCDEYCFDPNSAIGTPPEDLFDSNMNNYIAKAIQWDLPVSFLLWMGSPWADWNSTAPGSNPSTNLMAYLEKDINNVQWNQNNQVISDDDPNYQNPPLNTILSLNVYNTTVRKYLRRNSLAAAQMIKDFMNNHPNLFASVNITQDNYMQPWNGHGYYDYNPNTIKQFREWLQGTGVYAGINPDPYVQYNYTDNKRQPSLTLAQVNNIANKNWTNWNQVDPPRPSYPNANSNDPWWQEWTKFRQHVVEASTKEHINWIASIGIPLNRIFAHQGSGYDPKLVTDFVAGKDKSAGTLQGSAGPNWGTIGVNGPIDNLPWETPPSYYTKPLFQTYKSLTPSWGNFESHNITPENLGWQNPHYVPTYEQSWHGLVANYNHKAHNLSYLAWHAVAGDANVASHPHYNSFQGWLCVRLCPLEYATKDFVQMYGQFPRGTIMYEFGPPAHPVKDDWVALNHINNFTATAGTIQGNITGQDPYLLGPDHMDMTGTSSNLITYRYKLSAGGAGTANIFWITDADNGWGNNGKVYTFSITGDNTWRTATIPIGTNPTWTGTIRQIRIDPGNGPTVIGNTFNIDWVRIHPTTPIIPTISPTPTKTPTPIKTPTPVPPTPTPVLPNTPVLSLSGISCSPASIEVNWTRIPEASDYRLQRCTGINCGEINFTNPFGTIFAHATSFTDSTVSPDTTYKYRIRSHIASGNLYSDWSNIITVPLTCASPTPLPPTPTKTPTPPPPTPTKTPTPVPPTPTKTPTPPKTPTPIPPTPTKTPTPVPPTPTKTPTPLKSPTPSLTPIPGISLTPTLTSSAPIPGDANNDGKVNALDYNILFMAWNTTPPSDVRADFNTDGKVNALDYNLLFQNWGKTSIQ